MSLDLSRQFLKLLVHFRQHDLKQFVDEHARLYSEAEQSQDGDYSRCIAHYYSLMSKLIDEYFSGSFHFVPPLPKSSKVLLSAGRPIGCSLAASLRLLHIRIGECLELGPEKYCADIGCGIGDVIEHLASTGAQLTGLTIAPNEVQTGNANFRALGIHSQCRILEADCSKALPFSDGFLHAAYAIYSLKYIGNLQTVFRELARAVRAQGLVLVYDLLKTDLFDETDPLHGDLLAGLQFACGMPPFHSRRQMIEEAEKAGFQLILSVDLDKETGLPFYHWFSHSPLFMWMMRSPLVGHLIKLAQLLRILPRGFHRFNKIFLSGTVDKIVRAGQMGILSGSEILLFRRLPQIEG